MPKKAEMEKWKKRRRQEHLDIEDLGFLLK